jgi:hypothetical protein
MLNKAILISTYLWSLTSKAHYLNISIDLLGRPFKILVHHPTIFSLLGNNDSLIFSRLWVLLMKLADQRRDITAWRSTLVLRILRICPSSVICRLFDSNL